MVKYKDTYIYKAEFSPEETRELIKMARENCGDECEITIDTVDGHYWNYKVDPKQQDKSWGDSIYTDFDEFEMPSLKMCVEIFDENAAKMLQKYCLNAIAFGFRMDIGINLQRKLLQKKMQFCICVKRAELLRMIL